MMHISSCSFISSFFPIELPQSTSLCTTSGWVKGSGSSWECAFPFKHEGAEYNGCVQPSLQDSLSGSHPWCPTVTDVEGSYERFRQKIAKCRPHCKVVCDILFKVSELIDIAFSFIFQDSKGVWLGWIITPVAIVIIHVILITVNNKHIAKTMRAQKALPLLSKQVDLEEFLSRSRDMLPGIQVH